MVKWIDALLYAFLVDIFDHLDSELLRHVIAELDHLLELPCRVDMQERKWRLLGVKCFHRQMQHDGAVLSDGIKHNRLLTLGCHFSDNVNRFCFQFIQM